MDSKTIRICKTCNTGYILPYDGHEVCEGCLRGLALSPLCLCRHCAALPSDDRQRRADTAATIAEWVTGKLTCRVCDKVGLSRLDKHLADLHQLPPNDQLPLDSWLPPHPPLPPCLSIQWIALPLSSPVQCMSCTALEKRVEGLELAVCQLQATMSLQLDSSTATAQATSSAALASPSPGNTHSLDRETPSTPRSPASPASLQGVVTTLCDSQALELQAGRTKLLLQGSSPACSRSRPACQRS
ncbi:unnamed protein product [Arctogadus glacialis]